ncbi:MAG: ABC transporter ATP-binding protein/permease [Coriobacteriales bacterium]|jgi:ATP-binding cassette subfamily C protein|nr:ABC transporter ATP-binding protein/permease [Coriobacteriales bacterium]
MSEKPSAQKPTTAAVFARLLTLLAPLRAPMLAAVLFGVLANLCVIFIPVLGGMALASIAGLGKALSPALLMALIASCALGRTAFRYVEQLLNHHVAFTLLATIRSRVFEALRRLAPARLEGHDRGDLIALITADVELLEVFYAHTVSPVAIAAVVCTAMVVSMGTIHPLLALVQALAYVVVGVVMPRLYLRLTAQPGRDVREGFGKLNAFFFDSLRGLEQSIQYGEGDARRDTINRMGDALAGRLRRLRWLEARGSASALLAVLFFSAAILLVAIALYGSGAIDGSGVIVSTLAMMSSFGPVLALAALSHGLAQTTGAARRIFAVLDEAPAVEEVTGGVDTGFSGASLEGVCFSYGDRGRDGRQDVAAVPAGAKRREGPAGGGSHDAPVSGTRGESPSLFEDFDLALPFGATIGIVGKSGSGKSTLVKLLMRFWDVEGGRVLLSGHPIKDINTSALREMQSHMAQDTQLLDRSLYDNIILARPDATREEVEAACGRASILAFIQSLPEGFDTRVGELGERLSGGERQRIGLARAFLHDGPLMILDEPTSNLDSLNEAAILKSLHEARAGATVILVSHRASTMRVADEIYELERDGDS